MTTKGSDAGKLLSIVARAVAFVLGLTGQPFLFGRFEIGAHGVVAVQGRRVVLERFLGMQIDGWRTLWMLTTRPSQSDDVRISGLPSTQAPAHWRNCHAAFR